MKSLMLKLEPVIWGLFGGGMMVGGLLLPGFIFVLGIAAPLGFAPDAVSSFEHLHDLASHPLGRLVCLAAIALPLWGGAHHVRHVWIDLGGLKSDGLVGALCYGVALLGSVAAIVAVVRL